MPYININKLKIFYLENKIEGIPLIFIHGWLGNSYEWIHQLCYFKSIEHLILLDLPGFGKSDKPKIHYSIDLFSELILSFIDTLGYREIILIGHSLGGMIAQDFTIKNPTIVKKLILIGTSSTFSQSFREKFILFWVNLIFKINYRNFLKNIVKEILSSPYENKDFKRLYNRALKLPKSVVLSTFKKMTSKNTFSNNLSNIKQPTLLIYGMDDKIISKSRHNDLNELLVNSEIHVIENSHHRVMVESHEKVNELIKNFIRK